MSPQAAAGSLVAGTLFTGAAAGVHLVADATVGSSSGLLVTCVSVGGGIVIALISAVVTFLRNKPTPASTTALEDHALEQVVAEQAAKIVQLEATVAALKRRRS